MAVDVEYPSLAQPVKRQLNFFAQSAIVDNYTGNYVNVSGGRTCPPYTIGWTTMIAAATQAAEATLVAAAGSLPVPSLPTSPAFGVVVTFTDQLLPVSNGVSLQPTVINVGTISGSVVVSSISGTVQVNLASQSGTLNVQFPSAQSVTISGTPAVTIASGTVSIGGTPNINISSQSVNVNTAQPQSTLANLTFPNGVSTQTTAAAPIGTHSLGLWSLTTNGILTITQIRGHTSGNIIYPQQGLNSQGINGGYGLVVPVDSTQDTQYDITATAAGISTVHVTAYLDTSSVYVISSPFAPVFVVPAPFVEQQGSMFLVQRLPYTFQSNNRPGTGTAASVIIAAVAGKSIYLDFASFSAWTAATAILGNVYLILDGITEIWADLVNIPANSTTRYPNLGPGSGFHSSPGNSLTVKFNGNAVGAAQAIGIGGWQLTN